METGEYFRIHEWLVRHNGRAIKCENKDCSSINPKRYEWALVKGKEHKKDINNYIQLCPSCHRKYDFTDTQRQKMRNAKLGKPAVNRKPVILNNEMVFQSITEAAKHFNIRLSTITNNIIGLSKTTKQGTWQFHRQS